MNITTTSNCHHFIRLRCDSALIHTPLRVSMAKAVGFSARSFPFYPCFSRDIPRMPLIASAKRNDSQADPLLDSSIVDEVHMDVDEDDEFIDELEEDELLEDDGYFEDEEPEPSEGDGAGGGGVSTWDKKALEIAEEVSLSFNGELGIYAFRSLLNATVQVRIERLTNKSGSPSMTDIESFSTT